MPVTGGKRRRADEDIESEERKEKRQKQKTDKERVLYEYESIGYTEDKWHTLIRMIPENINECSRLISRNVCSFLNGYGGILCFGCRPNGKIYGEAISRKEEDNLRCIIDEILKRMHPFVSPSRYRVNFIPVKSRYSTFSTTNHHILEIKVERGDPYELYETEFHEAFLRTDSGVPYGPLTPHEIKRHVLQQYRKKLESKTKLCNVLKRSSSTKNKRKAIVRPLDTTQSIATTSNSATPINKALPHPLSVSRKATPEEVVTATMKVPDPAGVTITIESSSATKTIGIALPASVSTSTSTVTTTVSHTPLAISTKDISQKKLESVVVAPEAKDLVKIHTKTNTGERNSEALTNDPVETCSKTCITETKTESQNIPKTQVVTSNANSSSCSSSGSSYTTSCSTISITAVTTESKANESKSHVLSNTGSIKTAKPKQPKPHRSQKQFNTAPKPGPFHYPPYLPPHRPTPVYPPHRPYRPPFHHPPPHPHPPHPSFPPHPPHPHPPHPPHSSFPPRPPHPHPHHPHPPHPSFPPHPPYHNLHGHIPSYQKRWCHQ